MMNDKNNADLISPEALRVVATVADAGSMAGAARKLGLVPSAVTYRIRQIEDALDVLLFDRSARQARLTPAGSALLGDGMRVLAELDAVARRVKRIATGWEPQLCVACDSLISPNTVFELTQAFLSCGPDQQAPPTRLRLQRETLSGTWQSLIDGEADLALGVVAETSALRGLRVKPLGEVAFVFAVAPHHPLAGALEPISDAVLQTHRIVAVADSTRRGGGLSVGILPGQDTLTVSAMPDKLNAQLRGLGCGFLPECLVRAHIDAGRLVVKRTQRTPRTSRLSFAWRESSAQPGRALSWWLGQLESPKTRQALLMHH